MSIAAPREVIEMQKFSVEGENGAVLEITGKIDPVTGSTSYTWTETSKEDREEQKTNPQRSPRLIDDVDGGEAKRALIQALWNAGIPKELTPYKMAYIVEDEGWVPGEDLDRARAELSAAERKIQELQDRIVELEDHPKKTPPGAVSFKDALSAYKNQPVSNHVTNDSFDYYAFPDISSQLEKMPAVEAYRQMKNAIEKFRTI